MAWAATQANPTMLGIRRKTQKRLFPRAITLFAKGCRSVHAKKGATIRTEIMAYFRERNGSSLPQNLNGDAAVRPHNCGAKMSGGDAGTRLRTRLRRGLL